MVTIQTTPVDRSGRAAKTARLDLRVTPEQKRHLEEAAALAEQSVTEFVVASARSAANEILADRTRFVLSPDQWTAFMDAIDRPPRYLPKLASLLSSPSVLDAE